MTTASLVQSPLVDRLIALALEEDLVFGDITSEACVPVDHRSLGKVIAREPLVVAGLPLIERIVKQAGMQCEVVLSAAEGSEAKDGQVLAELKGATREILALERTILNFLQRLSGVASYTRSFIEKSAGIVVLDTRKTMPGWRILDKYAAKVGGARNHRSNLGEMLLIKNNHIDIQSGKSPADRVRAALKAALERKGYYTPVEVEVRNQEELRAALEFQPQAVLLDNFSEAEIGKALELIAGTSPAPSVEISGGITIDRLPGLRALRAPCVSVGALTTRAPNRDISLRVSSC